MEDRAGSHQLGSRFFGLMIQGTILGMYDALAEHYHLIFDDWD